VLEYLIMANNFKSRMMIHRGVLDGDIVNDPSS
jgi:hypothetical protein